MPRTNRWPERIAAVYLPVADTVEPRLRGHAGFVVYPVTDEDNAVAALLLDPEVRRAVSSGDLTTFERAAQRIRRAEEIAPDHQATQSLRRLGLR